MTHLLLTGHDGAADRATLQALVGFQRETPPAGLPARSAAEYRSGLAAFQARALAAISRPFDDRLLAAFERGQALLVDALQAQPVVALHPDLGGGAGPITLDIGRLLGRQPLDEDVALDLAVRWWQLARGAGLPVEADFGDTWRALEWTSLAQQLCQLATPGDKATEAHLLGQASKVALRYGSLKPLLHLMQPLGGAAPGAGFTF